MRLPTSIFVSVYLFTAETTAALYLSSTYSSAGDKIWQGLTLLFTLVPSVLVQLTLTFIHRDLSRDRPLILLLHILQLGPIVRSVRGKCHTATGVSSAAAVAPTADFTLSLSAHKLLSVFVMNCAHAVVFILSGLSSLLAWCSECIMSVPEITG